MDARPDNKQNVCVTLQWCFSPTVSETEKKYICMTSYAQETDGCMGKEKVTDPNSSGEIVLGNLVIVGDFLLFVL